MSDQSPNKGNGKNAPKKPKMNLSVYWIYGVVALVFVYIYFSNSQGARKDLKDESVFYTQMVPKDQVKKVKLMRNMTSGKIEYANVYLKESALNDYFPDGGKSKNPFLGSNTHGPHFVIKVGENITEVIDGIRKNNGLETSYGLYEYDDIEPDIFQTLITILLPAIFIVAIFVLIMRRMGGGGGPGGQIFNIGKSKAQLFDKDTNVAVTFNDVAGLGGAKMEVKEIVDFLKNPQKYTVLGAKIPKGALLVGPPGTGKTLLAKAVAGEAKVPFFSLSGSDFVEMFVGVGASRVRDLFKQAKEKAPCIIFIDEIDAIGRARGKNLSQGSNDERENTLNQLLTEMDGFGTNSGIIMLAATNRADILDRALMRAGRFDRTIYVDMPDLNERKEIFKVHLKPLKLNDDVDVDFLAKQTPGFSGADIANICNEAALIAARGDKKRVERQDFLDAVDRIIAGLEKKNKIITKKEKEVIAFHEAGHASVSWLCEYAHPLVKVTIVPRGQSLGAAWYLPEERQITTTAQILDEMCATLGGRAAEEIIFGEISTGALSDLEKVTKQAYAMTTIYGLNDKIGNLSYYDSSGSSDYSFSKPYSEATAEVIDEEVSKLVELQYERAKQILSENKDKLAKLANLLLEKEVIFKEDLEAVFGTRPGLTEEMAAEESSTSNDENEETVA